MSKQAQRDLVIIMALFDKDIREPLFAYFDEKYGKVRFFEEMDIASSKADVMMVTDDSITGFEIKSDADSYTRLKSQVSNYDKFFDYNYVVIGKSHLKHIEEHIPEYWGVMVCYKDDNGIHIEKVKEAQRNSKMMIKYKLCFLWRRELDTIKKEFLKYKYTHLSKEALRDKLIENIDGETLDSLVSRELFNRDYTTFEREII